jgi:large subunit ribosomal protein L24e
MVVKRQCSFCAGEIEPGTGLMFVKRDGTVFHFCSGSCRKQQLGLGRVGHRVRWTRAHTLKREQATAGPSATPSTRVIRGRGRPPGALPSGPSPSPAATAAPAPVAAAAAPSGPAVPAPTPSEEGAEAGTPPAKDSSAPPKKPRAPRPRRAAPPS